MTHAARPTPHALHLPRWARSLSFIATAALAACAGTPLAPTQPVLAPAPEQAQVQVQVDSAIADSVARPTLLAAPTANIPSGIPSASATATLPSASTVPATIWPAATSDLPAAKGPVDAAPGTPAGDPPQPLAVDPLRPTVPLDLDASATRQDLWGRVRSGYAVPDMDSDLVRKWEQWYASRPDYVRRMTERGGRYLFHIIEEVNKRGMPTELALLPFIESAFNPQAHSSAKASGMWQFVPATGRDFSLRQNIFRDDRRDVLASTRAALDYLTTLHGMFGDWQLALAAYNWGQGSVSRAIKRNQAAGLPTDYASLQMPDETRNYYPKLQAVKNIVGRPDAFEVKLPELLNHPYFISVAIDRDIDLDLAARLAGLPLDEFKALNPQMNKPVILAAGTQQVLLPYDNANTFVHALRKHRGPWATWTAWVAPKTMKSAEAARLVGMTEERLREVNNIPPRMLVKAQSTLMVLRDPRRGEDVAEQVADNAMLALAPDLPPFKRVSFKVGKRGDSVVAVARRYKLNPAQVAQLNKTSVAGQFKRGEVVVVMVPVKARAGARAVAEVAARSTTRVAASGLAETRTAKAAPAGRPSKAARSGVGRAQAAAKPSSTVRVATRTSGGTAKPPAAHKPKVHGRVRVAQN